MTAAAIAQADSVRLEVASNSLRHDGTSMAPPPMFGVMGTGGFARELMPLLRRFLVENPALGALPETAVFVDRKCDAPINGHAVVGQEDFLSHPGRRQFVVGVGDGALRSKIQEAAEMRGAEALVLAGSWCTIFDDVDLAVGSVLCGRVTVTSNVRIGRGFQANINSIVAHDCLIGDYVTLAPGVVCNGNVVIEDYAYIGAGAVLRQGSPGKPLRVGKGAIVGMGAIVTKDVPDGVTVAGNPARPLVKEPQS